MAANPTGLLPAGTKVRLTPPRHSADAAPAQLQLSKICQQRNTLLGAMIPRSSHPSDDMIARQLRWGIDPGHAPEERVVVVEHLLERRGGVVVKIRGRLPMPRSLVMSITPIPLAASEQHPPGVRGRDDLESAIPERDLVGPCIAL